MEKTALSDFLFWLMSAGGGVATYALVKQVAFLQALEPKAKRWVALLLSAVIPLLAWGAAIGMGYIPQPATVEAAIEEAFALVGAAFGLSQMIHAKDLV